MGQQCCRPYAQEPSFDHLRLKIGPLDSKPQISTARHEPNKSFAVPFSQQINFSENIDARVTQLGFFNYDSGCQAGYQVPEGKFLNSYKLNNGSIYAGQWNNGKINGRGIYALPDQTLIYAVSQENQLKGRVRVVYPNGDYFEGNTLEGKANGKGKYVQQNVTFQGQFKDNLIDGKGIEKGQDYLFQGTFSMGQKKYGKLTWMDSEEQHQYTGSFFNNKFQGDGNLISKDGKYVGQFKNGLKSGKGKFFYKNHRYYDGFFAADVRNGQGAIIDEIEGKIVTKGRWINDVFVGK